MSNLISTPNMKEIDEATPSESPFSNKQRMGTWTKEEEEYVDVLVKEFKSGHLLLETGVSLRGFLAKMVHCSPKRISKKLEGTDYNGRLKYIKSIHGLDDIEGPQRQARLEDLEMKFEASVVRLAESQDVESNKKRPYREAHTAHKQAKKRRGVSAPGGGDDHDVTVARSFLASRFPGAMAPSASPGPRPDANLTNPSEDTPAGVPNNLSWLNGLQLGSAPAPSFQTIHADPQVVAPTLSARNASTTLPPLLHRGGFNDQQISDLARHAQLGMNQRERDNVDLLSVLQVLQNNGSGLFANGSNGSGLLNGLLRAPPATSQFGAGLDPQANRGSGWGGLFDTRATRVVQLPQQQQQHGQSNVMTLHPLAPSHAELLNAFRSATSNQQEGPAQQRSSFF